MVNTMIWKAHHSARWRRPVRSQTEIEPTLKIVKLESTPLAERVRAIFAEDTANTATKKAHRRANLLPPVSNPRTTEPELLLVLLENILQEEIQRAQHAKMGSIRMTRTEQ